MVYPFQSIFDKLQIQRKKGKRKSYFPMNVLQKFCISIILKSLLINLGFNYFTFFNYIQRKKSKIQKHKINKHINKQAVLKFNLNFLLSTFQYAFIQKKIQYTVQLTQMTQGSNPSPTTKFTVQSSKPQQTPKQSPSLNDKKKKLQNIWRLIFLFITIGSTIFFEKIYRYHTQQFFASIRKGSLTALCTIGIPFAVIFLLADMLSHRVFDSLCQKYYISHTKYPDQQIRKKRCYTIVKWGFTIFYYGLTSIAAYFILLNTSYMPTWLGGNGDCTDCLRYVNSFDQATRAMQIYYGIQFGKHFGRFFQHVFIRPQGNFYEYTLHHALSMFLIFFSYMMNFWMIGIFLLMVHDISDFFLIIPRAYRDCKVIYKPLLQLQYLIMAFTWLSCRIFMLSYCAVYTAVKNLYYVAMQPEMFQPIQLEIMYLPAVLMAVMISALEVLQLFWTYHIITSFIQVNVSSKIAKHTYD